MRESDPHAEAKQAMRGAIETLRKSHDEAATALAMIDEITDTQAALDLANDLAEALQEIADWAFALRRRLVGRIWRAEELSLARLAERARVSKSRADQLVREFKREDMEEASDE
jgi:hypothetical protein